MRLVIDTATAACSVALLEGQTLIACEKEMVGRGHAEKLLPMIAALPEKGHADHIIVDCGPGSFTGVRVGLAAALALGLGWDAPVTGYASTDLVAGAVFANKLDVSNLTVAFTGGHGELFIQSFTRLDSPARFKALTDLESMRPEVAATRVQDEIIIGSGASALIEARGHGESVEAWPWADDVQFLENTFVNLSPTPIYGRAPDAKISL
ncbi:MAG: tRNA (adenosine(37)-N6)-threonylcarbamoyltransferase complex dimerization subunit type 1 TsaB [Zymomonas mobilis subsp. pomaceae]|uniref:Peptidase M22 glycoprotease n=1 Tax=Zymomonas mobilis subsp. pomaceae (strain ATCC 29192 / DSM 22645 / JCM 10191 / CCUG 17912 / NBRC 13757 / NCIMB 11200 / NRRL B-4491 / Barker I) TaxID=579138 RepID=F8EWC9_ZYMMT|nr:tRNA (adenosine(37)-N6)-threonylcarbamoyltransferase complex dimerization subunit type 1 TsaB [Zymomonas mobilis]AEI38539.1 peptidase M22 glycoprotease [Zymomonas mobilis subsp. pomaceae ATCC 29192]MDX5948229.1 tRNA (adenosine(37)-N6)-threonylcarbamoyltransferase complex dimerization subunit type 1 TsaB [Zymomonas mobilis subsp. pomaceae]GEB88984.1 tRNA (adenosine(37)-N6)-threonylcarbamoyltransferase complex dimerization subunit type 1 TsaB [Zymomonas mobilis subsp. pomaceae]